MSTEHSNQGGPTNPNAGSSAIPTKSETETTSVSESASEMCAVKIRKPEVSGDPEAWFLQLEAQFTSKMTDKSKFRGAVSVLPQSYFNTAINLIRNPPPSQAYSTLKQRIIKKHSESEETRLKKLLEHQSADEPPSDAYNRLAELAGETVNAKFLFNIWSMRLPLEIRFAIESHTDKPIDTVLEIADSLHEKLENNRKINSINRPGNSSHHPEESRLSRIERQLASLTHGFKKRQVTPSRKHRPTSHSRSRHGGSARTHRSPNRQECWYHSRFGKNAKHCTKPCVHFTNNLN